VAYRSRTVVSTPRFFFLSQARRQRSLRFIRLRRGRLEGRPRAILAFSGHPVGPDQPFPPWPDLRPTYGCYFQPAPGSRTALARGRSLLLKRPTRLPARSRWKAQSFGRACFYPLPSFQIETAFDGKPGRFPRKGLDVQDYPDRQTAAKSPVASSKTARRIGDQDYRRLLFPKADRDALPRRDGGRGGRPSAPPARAQSYSRRSTRIVRRQCRETGRRGRVQSGLTVFSLPKAGPAFRVMRWPKRRSFFIGPNPKAHRGDGATRSKSKKRKEKNSPTQPRFSTVPGPSRGDRIAPSAHPRSPTMIGYPVMIKGPPPAAAGQGPCASLIRARRFPQGGGRLLARRSIRGEIPPSATNRVVSSRSSSSNPPPCRDFRCWATSTGNVIYLGETRVFRSSAANQK